MLALYFDIQSMPRMTSKPNMLNTASFTGKVLPSITIGHLSTHFLQVMVSPTGVATHIFCPNGSVLNLHNFTYDKEINECVAPESNNTQATLPNKGIVPVTTSVVFSSARTLSGVSANTLAGAVCLG
jgi:hypothetical protein